MTRKCAICKSKNYKNTYSFFSAPKDADTRRLWQKAINIKDYIVNNETFVCSKHFKKDDIITHWVSGVPPQVITIKYKKCRLRRGAIPIPVNVTENVEDETPEEFKNDEIILDGKKYCKNIDLSNTEEVFNDTSNCNLEDEIYEYIPEDTQDSTELQNALSVEPSKRRKVNENKDCQNESSNQPSNDNKDIMYINCTNSNSIFTKENDESIQIHLGNSQNILTYFPKKSYLKTTEKVFNKPLAPLNTKYNQMINSVNYWNIDSLNENLEIGEFDEKLTKDDELMQVVENDDSYSMLFEDFLEVYNELTLPSNWSASMVCKELATTIVYSCMNISSTGMPYIEKKVFLNNEMILHCGIFTKEIELHSIFKSIKSLKVNSLVDIEDFIDKLDKTPLCTGISNKNFKYDNDSIMTLDDGIQRHYDCSLAVDKGCSICLCCSTLLINENNSDENDTITEKIDVL